MRRLTVGFIGCGGIAEAHAKSLSNIKNVEFKAFSDIVRARAESFASTYGGEAYEDWRKMLEKVKPDVVFICLPPFAHSDEVMVAAENGVNIYIEKPIALDIKLAREMARAVEKHGVKSQVGYQSRFGAGVEKAKSLIESNSLGSIGLASGKYWCRFIRKDWWIDKSKSGGQIVEQSTHLYDILVWLCGDVKRVYAEMDRLLYKDVEGMTIEDVSGVVLRFSSGAVGVVTATIGASPYTWGLKWSIVGWDAMLESENPNQLTIHWSSKTQFKIEEFNEPFRDTMRLAELDLINAILEDRATRTPISEGVKTLEVTLAAVKSAEEGRPITLPL